MSARVHLRDPDEAVAWLQQHAGPQARLCSDSRAIRAGDVFLAWPGRTHDARRHVAAALQAGAVAALVEGADGAQLRTLPDGQGHIASYAGLQAASGEIASLWFGRPSQGMEVVAITGTNGKTTLAWWLSQALAHAGQRCGYVGTLGTGMPPQVQESGLTSPDALQLQQVLADLRATGVRACAIEASSIGLAQGRLAGTSIRVAVFTNLTQDHLDYHGTMQAYADAKATLFRWPGLQAAVLNAQDAQGRRWRETLIERGELAVWDYAVHAEGRHEPARLVATDLQFADGVTHLTVHEYAPGAAPDNAPAIDQVALHAPVVGLFNAHNLMALVGTLRALGLSLAQAGALCAQLPPVPGRMQASAAAGKPMVVVDYAHTPDALRAALVALKPLAQRRGGRLIALFGCGGDRDTSKRPLMAMAAAQQADGLWITSDNPRSEEPRAIIAQIETGLTQAQRASARIEADRRAAIAQAIAQADAADVVLVAGKGHETYQEIKGVRHAFSDAAEVAQALAHWRGHDGRGSAREVAA